MGGGKSLFDDISQDDLIIAFFPCIHFCDAKTLFFKCTHISQKKWSLEQKMKYNIEQARTRQQFFELWMKMYAIVDRLHLRMIVENPMNNNGMSFLENNFFNPSLLDKNRRLRGDYFIKPTGYWFVNAMPTNGFTMQKDKEPKAIMYVGKSKEAGICSEDRSMISPDYARNFICDNILGKAQKHTQLDLFD